MSAETITITIQGTSGDDTRLGWGTQDYDPATYYFYGGAGNDTMWSPGYWGTAHMYGGTGNDEYHVGYRDTAYEKAGEGIDTVVASNSYSLHGQFIENIQLVDVNPATATGNSLRNSISGNHGDNTLYGMGGDDTLNGMRGDDVLWGGAGKDTFAFSWEYEWDAHGDTIADFEHGIDKIDLPDLASGYTFIGTERFHNVRGELHIYHLADGNTYVSGDFDGDARSDFTIKVLGNHVFTKDDFIL